LCPGEYQDRYKKRLLLRNLQGIPGLDYPLQNCRDYEYTYQESASYLRTYGARLAVVQPHDNEDDVRMGGMVSTTYSTPTLPVQEQVDYAASFDSLTKPTQISHAICDRGADSCVVGTLAKVLHVTKRTATLVGYDPKTTKSSSLPIVTALLKTISSENIPILLRVNEAVYNQDSPTTLLSEYQIRDFGLAVDSVASKHLSAQGIHGTQTLSVSDIVKCPLVDRGGVMGITLYPIEDGDENRYDIFDITSKVPWKPKSSMTESRIYSVTTSSISKSATQECPQLLAKSVVCPMHSSGCANFDHVLEVQLQRAASNGGIYGLPQNLKISLILSKMIISQNQNKIQEKKTFN